MINYSELMNDIAEQDNELAAELADKIIADMTPTEKLNLLLTMEIPADQVTPIDFSKARVFRSATYALCVEIKRRGIVYTIRKKTKFGYTRIIERDACYVAIADAWTIYINA